jgi:hypothetical protein
MDPDIRVFIDRTQKDLAYIRAKVDTLWDFRIMVIGGSIAMSALASAVISIAAIYFGVSK